MNLPPGKPLPPEDQERAGIPQEEQLYDGEQMLGDLFDGKAAAVPDPKPHEAREENPETLEDLFDDLVLSPAAEEAQASPDAPPYAEEVPDSGTEREEGGEKKGAAEGKKRVPDFKKRREWPQKKDESLSEPPVDIGIEFVGFRQ